jgi:hypothetical protein
MLKAVALVIVSGAIVLATAIPVISTTDGGTVAETRAMLLAATAFFGLSWAMRWRPRGPRRGGPTRPA